MSILFSLVLVYFFLYIFSINLKMSTSNLRVLSYNCRSFNSKTVYIDSLLKCCDILCLQETFLSDDQADNFEPISSSNGFVYTYSSAVRRNDVVSGRSSGGLAILWRKNIAFKCTPMMFSERILGLMIEVGNNSYLILNVYFFCDYGDVESLLNYKSMLAEISSICEDTNFDEIIIIGDMNADTAKG